MIGGPMACVFGRCRYGPFSLGRPSSLLLLLRGTPSAVGSEVCGSPSLASPSVRRGRPSRLVWVLELLTARRRVGAPRLVSAEEGQVAATGKEGARCRTERGRWRGCWCSWASTSSSSAPSPPSTTSSASTPTGNGGYGTRLTLACSS